MVTRKSLADNIAIVYFKYPDGSTVRSKCTASRSIYESLNGYYDSQGLYDVEVMRRIPDEYLDLDCDIYENEETEIDTRNSLDKFLEPYIKSLW